MFVNLVLSRPWMVKLVKFGTRSTKNKPKRKITKMDPETKRSIIEHIVDAVKTESERPLCLRNETVTVVESENEPLCPHAVTMGGKVAGHAGTHVPMGEVDTACAVAPFEHCGTGTVCVASIKVSDEVDRDAPSDACESNVFVTVSHKLSGPHDMGACKDHHLTFMENVAPTKRDKFREGGMENRKHLEPNFCVMKSLLLPRKMVETRP